MNEAPRTIRVTPRSELALVVKDAERAGQPLLVDTGEIVYRLSVDSKEKTEPKSKRMKGRLMALAGVWSDLDADSMIERLYKARHEAPPSDPLKL